HGTGVAGLAAGEGSAAGIATGVGALNISYPVPLTTRQSLVGTFPVDTTAATGAGTVTARLKWQAALPGVVHTVELLADPVRNSALLGRGWTPATGAQPFAITVAGLPPGIFSSLFRITAGTSTDLPASPLPAW